MFLKNKEATMKLTNIAILTLMSFLIVACGGGGSSATSTPVTTVIEEPVTADDSSTSEDTEIETETEPEIIVEPDTIYDTTAELVVDKPFLLKPEYELLVTYKNDNKRSAYLSVCTEFTEEQDVIKVNYNSCLLRTSIDSDYEASVTVANDKNQLVMAIWYLDDINKPRYEVWENNNTQGVKVFEVN